MGLWSAVKKSINSDIRTPLNHLIWLNDYKTYGNNSYVYNDKKIWNELIASPAAANDTTFAPTALDRLISNNDTRIGEFLTNIYGVDTDLRSFTNIDDVLESETAMSALGKVSIAVNSFMNSTTIVGRMLSSETVLMLMLNIEGWYNQMFNNINIMTRFSITPKYLNALAKYSRVAKLRFMASSHITTCYSNIVNSLNNTTYFQRRVNNYTVWFTTNATSYYSNNGLSSYEPTNAGNDIVAVTSIRSGSSSYNAYFYSIGGYSIGSTTNTNPETINRIAFEWVRATCTSSSSGAYLSLYTAL